jgi:ketopantoate reductase
MNVLVVGAGAVGQVYGWHLRQAGARVAFWVKERHLSALAKGFVLYDLRQGRAPAPLLWEKPEAIHEIEVVGATKWDQIWVTIPSDAARRDDDLQRLFAAAPDATVVSMLPGGADDRELLLQWVTEDRLVNGQINLISYQAPLPGETRFLREGTAFWLPPLLRSPFSGPAHLVELVVSTLVRGGQPAAAAVEVWRGTAWATAASTPFLLALEASGWSFAELRRNAGLDLAARAAGQSAAVIAAQRGVRVPLAVGLVANAFVARFILIVGPWLLPLPLETYLRFHYTKIRTQTRESTRKHLERGQALRLPMDALQTLLASVP